MICTGWKNNNKIKGGLSPPIMHTNVLGTCLYDSWFNTIINSVRIELEILSIHDTDNIDLSDKGKIYGKVLSNWIQNPLGAYECPKEDNVFVLMANGDSTGEVAFSNYKDMLDYQTAHSDDNLIEVIDYKRLIKLFMSRYLKFTYAFAHTTEEYIGIEEGVVKVPTTKEEGDGKRKRLFESNDILKSWYFNNNKYIYVTNKFANLIWACVLMAYHEPKIDLKFNDIVKLSLDNDDILQTDLFTTSNMFNADINIINLYKLFDVNAYPSSSVGEVIQSIVTIYNHKYENTTKSGDIFFEISKTNYKLYNILQDLYNENHIKARKDLVALSSNIFIFKNHLIVLTDTILVTTGHAIYYDILNNIISDNYRRFYYPIEYFTENINNIVNIRNKVFPLGMVSSDDLPVEYVPYILHYQVFYLSEADILTIQESVPKFMNIVRTYTYGLPTVPEYLNINNIGLYSHSMANLTYLLMTLEHKLIKPENILYKRHQKNIEQLQSSIKSPYSKIIPNVTDNSIFNDTNLNASLIIKTAIPNLQLVTHNIRCTLLSICQYYSTFDSEEQYKIFIDDPIKGEFIYTIESSDLNLSPEDRSKADTQEFTGYPTLSNISMPNSQYIITMINDKSKYYAMRHALHIYMFLRRSNIVIYYMRRIPSSYSYEVKLMKECEISSINNALRNKDYEFAVVKASVNMIPLNTIG